MRHVWLACALVVVGCTTAAPSPTWHLSPAPSGTLDGGERVVFGYGTVVSSNEVLGKVSSENQARVALTKTVENFLTVVREAYYEQKTGDRHVIAPGRLILGAARDAPSVDRSYYDEATETHYARASVRLGDILEAVERVGEMPPDMRVFYRERGPELFDRHFTGD